MRLIATSLAGERGGDTIFAGISFELGTGDALVVYGPNGAGKSTLLRIIAGLLPPAAGSVRLEGGGETCPDAAAASHYLGHRNALKPALTVRENLQFWQRFLGPGREVGEALQALGLDEISRLPFGVLSAGQKRRAAIAVLLGSRRPIWLLDEPTSGLDRAAATRLLALLAEHRASGGIVVATTHLPLELPGAQSLRLGGGVDG